MVAQKLARSAAVLVASAVFVAALASGATADPAKSVRGGCSDVIFIGARGSGEAASSKSAGMGPSVYYMAQRMKSRLGSYGISMSLQGVEYPALGIETLVPSKRQLALLGASPVAALTAYKKNNFNRYIGSINTGTSRVRQTIETAASICEDSDIILGGYSQGAMAVHEALLNLDDAESEAGYAVAGSLLLADGDRAANSNTRRFGSAPRGGEGIRTYFHGNDRRDVPDPEYTVSICDDGDLVCDFDLDALRHAAAGKSKHVGYLANRKSVLNSAVDWLAWYLYD